MKVTLIFAALTPVMLLLTPTSFGQLVELDAVNQLASSSLAGVPADPTEAAWAALPPTERALVMTIAHEELDRLDRGVVDIGAGHLPKDTRLAALVPKLFVMVAADLPSSGASAGAALEPLVADAVVPALSGLGAPSRAREAAGALSPRVWDDAIEQALRLLANEPPPRGLPSAAGAAPPFTGLASPTADGLGGASSQSISTPTVCGIGLPPTITSGGAQDIDTLLAQLCSNVGVLLVAAGIVAGVASVVLAIVLTVALVAAFLAIDLTLGTASMAYGVAATALTPYRPNPLLQSLINAPADTIGPSPGPSDLQSILMDTINETASTLGAALQTVTRPMALTNVTSVINQSLYPKATLLPVDLLPITGCAFALGGPPTDPSLVGKSVQCLADTLSSKAQAIVEPGTQLVNGASPESALRSTAHTLGRLPPLVAGVLPYQSDSSPTTLPLVPPSLPPYTSLSPAFVTETLYAQASTAYQVVCLGNAVTGGLVYPTFETADSLFYNLRTLRAGGASHFVPDLPVGVAMDIDLDGTLPAVPDTPAAALAGYELRVTLTVVSTTIDPTHATDLTPTLRIESLIGSPITGLLADAYLQVPQSQTVLYVGYDYASLPASVIGTAPIPTYFEVTAHRTTVSTSDTAYSFAVRSTSPSDVSTTASIPRLPVVAGTYQVRDCDPTKPPLPDARAMFGRLDLSSPVPATVSVSADVKTVAPSTQVETIAWGASAASTLALEVNETGPDGWTRIGGDIVGLPQQATLTYTSDGANDGNATLDYTATSTVSQASFDYAHFDPSTGDVSVLTLAAQSLPLSFTYAATPLASYKFNVASGSLGELDVWMQRGGLACEQAPSQFASYVVYSSVDETMCGRLRLLGLSSAQVLLPAGGLNVTAKTSAGGGFFASLDTQHDGRTQAELSNLPASLSLDAMFTPTAGNVKWRADATVDTVAVDHQALESDGRTESIHLAVAGLPKVLNADFNETTKTVHLDASSTITRLELTETNESRTPSYPADYVYMRSTPSGETLGARLTGVSSITIDHSSPSATSVRADVDGEQPATLYVSDGSNETWLNVSAVPRGLTFEYQDDAVNQRLVLDYAAMDPVANLEFTRFETTGTWRGALAAVPTRLHATADFFRARFNASLPAGPIGAITMERTAGTSRTVPSADGDYAILNLTGPNGQTVNTASIHVTGFAGGYLEWLSGDTLKAHLARSAASDFTFVYLNKTTSITAVVADLPSDVYLQAKTGAQDELHYAATAGSVIPSLDIDASLPGLRLRAHAENIPSRLHAYASTLGGAFNLSTNALAPMTNVLLQVDTRSTVAGQTTGNYTRVTSTSVGNAASFSYSTAPTGATFRNTLAGLPLATDLVAMRDDNVGDSDLLLPETIPGDGLVMHSDATTLRLVAVLHGLSAVDFSKDSAGTTRIHMEKGAAPSLVIDYDDAVKNDVAVIRATPSPLHVDATVSLLSVGGALNVHFGSSLDAPLSALGASLTMKSVANPFTLDLSAASYPASMRLDYDQASSYAVARASSPTTIQFEFGEATRTTWPSEAGRDYLDLDPRNTVPVVSALFTGFESFEGRLNASAPMIDYQTSGSPGATVVATLPDVRISANLSALAGGEYRVALTHAVAGENDLDWRAPAAIALANFHVAPPSDDSTKGVFLDATVTSLPSTLHASWAEGASGEIDLRVPSPIGLLALYYANASQLPQAQDGDLFYIEGDPSQVNPYTNALAFAMDGLSSVSGDWTSDATTGKLVALSADIGRGSAAGLPLKIVYANGGMVFNASGTLFSTLGFYVEPGARAGDRVAVLAGASGDPRIYAALSGAGGGYLIVSLSDLPSAANFVFDPTSAVDTLSWSAAKAVAVALDTTLIAPATAPAGCTATTASWLNISTDHLPARLDGTFAADFSQASLIAGGGDALGNTRFLYERDANAGVALPSESSSFVGIGATGTCNPYVVGKISGLQSLAMSSPTGKLSDSFDGELSLSKTIPDVKLELPPSGSTANSGTKIELEGIGGVTRITYSLQGSLIDASYFASQPLGRLTVDLPGGATSSFGGDSIASMHAQVTGVSATTSGGPAGILRLTLGGSPTYDPTTGFGGAPTFLIAAYASPSSTAANHVDVQDAVVNLTLAAATGSASGGSAPPSTIHVVTQGVGVGHIGVTATDTGDVATISSLDGIPDPDQVVVDTGGGHLRAYVDLHFLQSNPAVHFDLGFATPADLVIEYAGQETLGFVLSVTLASTTVQASLEPLPASGHLELHTDGPVTSWHSSSAFSSAAQFQLFLDTGVGVVHLDQPVSDLGHLGSETGDLLGSLNIELGHEFLNAASFHYAHFSTNSLISIDSENVTVATSAWDLFGETGYTAHPDAPVRQYLIDAACLSSGRPAFALLANYGDRGARVREVGACPQGYDVRWLNPTEGNGNSNDPSQTIFLKRNSPAGSAMKRHDVEYDNQWEMIP
ncbi:MAG: hypothetical protein ACYDCK_01800 [Thermoplasmatota archaeon]